MQPEGHRFKSGILHNILPWFDSMEIMIKIVL